MGEPKPWSRAALGCAGIYWDVLGCCAEGRGPSKPPGFGERPQGVPGSLKASAAAGSCPHGTPGVGSDVQLPSGVAKGNLLRHSLGWIELDPKPSALQWKEQALCSHG